MTERVINLSAAEAKAFAAGATALIRPSGCSAGEHASSRPDMRASWTVGDVLICREAWHWCTLHRDQTLYRASTALGQGCVANGGWRSPATMPKALARFRFPVVSVRVCRQCDVRWEEASAAAGHAILSRVAGHKAMGHLVGGWGEKWVSVTMLERTT